MNHKKNMKNWCNISKKGFELLLFVIHLTISHKNKLDFQLFHILPEPFTFYHVMFYEKQNGKYFITHAI